MFIYRDEYYLERSEPQPRAGQSDEKYDEEHRKWMERYEKSRGIADLLIAKQRNGPIGSIKLAFEPAHGRFYSLEYRDLIVNGH